MLLKNESSLRRVTGISPEQETFIKNFLQGAVYCWCKNRKDEWFSLRDLMGGDNYYWTGTPLQVLYDKHEVNDVHNPVERAGKDAGWLLKAVIYNDHRCFETRKANLIREYRWIPEQAT